MAPLSRAGILSLVALTLHFSVLSIVLHLSRSSSIPASSRYHASSAIFLTELFKIVLAGALVLVTGELRPKMADRKRMKLEREERRALKEQTEPAWIAGTGNEAEKRKEEEALLVQDGHHDWLEGAGTEPTPPPRRKSSTLRVDVGLAQSKAINSSTPAFSLIPATPAPEISPMRLPDTAGLYPTRPPLLQSTNTAVQDLGDADWWGTMKETVFGEGCWQLAFIAALFTIQGNLQYVASGNLSVPVFQLAYQLKIPATAMCSVLLLNRTLSQQQWIALVVLTSGVGIVQLYSIDNGHSSPSGSSSNTITDSNAPSQTLGLLAVVLACLSSGFASCFFEKVLKAPGTVAAAYKPSVWVRNVQLSCFGLAAGLPIVLWEMRDTWIENGGFEARTAVWTFFDGFNSVTWIVVFLQVTGGLLGAVVIQYADNLLKCFSTSLSILISVVASVALFNFQLSLGVCVGAIMVLASTYIYTNPAKDWRWRPAVSAATGSVGGARSLSVSSSASTSPLLMGGGK